MTSLLAPLDILFPKVKVPSDFSSNLLLIYIYKLNLNYFSLLAPLDAPPS